MRTYIKNSVLIANIFFSILLIFAWVGSFCFTQFSFFSLLALAFPLLLLINILLLLFWFFFTKSKENILISLISITFALFIIKRFTKINQIDQSQRGISVMSYNTKEFTPYQSLYYKEDLYLSEKRYSALIEKEDPDILCLQEFSERGNEIKKQYPYNILNTKLENKATRPLITLSKYPIINYFSVKIKGNYVNNLFVDVLIKKDTIRVVNLHMESLALRKSAIDSKKNIDYPLSKYFKLYKRLGDSFTLHKEQIDVIMKEVNQSPYPVVLCGDFNNTPFSYEYSKVFTTLNDSYIEKGNGIVDTYHPVPIPIRIDHIFASPSLKINSYDVVDTKISDHYPIKVSISIPE